MANFTSTIAILFTIFNLLQVALFEESQRFRKVIFSLIPILIPTIELATNIYYSVAEKRNLKLEFKLFFAKLLLFDYFERYEEATILNSKTIFCNQAYNESCRSPINRFYCFESPVDYNLPKIKTPYSNIKTIREKSFYPSGSFQFTVEIKTIGPSDKDAFDSERARFVKASRLADFVDEIDIYKSNEGLYKVLIEGGKATLVNKENKFRLDFSKLLSSIERANEEGLSTKSVEYGNNKFFKKSIHFQFRKEDRIEKNFDIGKMKVYFNFESVLYHLENGHSVSKENIPNIFSAQFKTWYILSCWSENSRLGITDDIWFCEVRSRNINHCYSMKELLNDIKDIRSGFKRISAYKYKEDCFYSESRKQNEKNDWVGYIITEGISSQQNHCTDLVEATQLEVETHNPETEQFGLRVLKMILNSIYGEFSRFFYNYIDIKLCSKLISKEMEGEIIKSICVDYFDERSLKGVNNWQRKRIKADLSSIKVAMGLDYFMKTDLNIKPTIDAVKVIKSLNESEIGTIDNSFLIKNIEKSNINLRNKYILLSIYRKERRINRSERYIELLSKINMRKTNSERGERRKEKDTSDTLRKSIEDLTNKKCKVKKAVFDEKARRYREEFLQAKENFTSLVNERVKNCKYVESKNKPQAIELYNPETLKSDYKEALLKSIDSSSKITLMQGVKEIIKKKKEDLKDKINHRLESTPPDFRKQYEGLNLNSKGGKEIEKLKNRRYRARMCYFIKKNETPELYNRYKVLEEGENSIEEILKSLKNDSNESHKKAKEIDCLYCFGFERLGVKNFYKKRQKCQNSNIASRLKSRVSRYKIADFDRNFVNSTKVKINLDFTGFQNAIDKFVSKPIINEIKTFKRKESPIHNHPLMEIALGRDFPKNKRKGEEGERTKGRKRGRRGGEGGNREEEEKGKREEEEGEREKKKGKKKSKKYHFTTALFNTPNLEDYLNKYSKTCIRKRVEMEEDKGRQIEETKSEIIKLYKRYRIRIKNEETSSNPVTEKSIEMTKKVWEKLQIEGDKLHGLTGITMDEFLRGIK